MQNPDVLALIASRLSNTELELLFEAGLWPTMSLFVGTQHFAYLRCRHELDSDLVWRHDWDWKRVYVDIRSYQCDSGDLSYTPSVQLLIESGRKFKMKKMTMLVSAVAGNATALDLILDNRADTKSSIWKIGSAFVLAATEGHLSIMHLLLDRYPHKVRPGKRSDALTRAASNGHTEVVAFLLSDPDLTVDHWTLTSCCGSGHADAARLLLADERVVLDEYSGELVLASHHGHAAMVQFLLSCSGRRRVKRDYQALSMAVIDGHYKVVRLLLEDGEINPNENRAEAFRRACARGKLKCARMIAEYGIRVNVDNNYALRFAASGGHEAVVAWLLSYDYVNPLVGRPNAVERAWKNGKTGVLDLLLRDRRVPISRVADRMSDYLKLLKPRINTRLAGYMFASAAYGDARAILSDPITALVDEPDLVARELLLALIVKRLDEGELAAWIGELECDQAEAAARSTLTSQPPRHTSDIYTCYRGLLLACMGHSWTTVLTGMSSESGVKESGLLLTAKALGLVLGVERLTLRSHSPIHS